MRVHAFTVCHKDLASCWRVMVQSTAGACLSEILSCVRQQTVLSCTALQIFPRECRNWKQAN